MSPEVEMEPSHKVDIKGGSPDTSGKNSSNKEKDTLPIETDKLKNRIRAFTGSFVVMISPVLLAIVLKKVNLSGAGKYQGVRFLEVFIDFVQGCFPHLAAATLQVGILPFLCVMMSEPCASYIAPRLLAASKVLVFVSNILLMVLGCGILLLIHKEAWLVLSLCSIMAVSVIVIHIISWCCCANNVGGTEDDEEYHNKLEHLLELAAGVTVMMFLVLEVVALEGLLRNNQGQAGLLMPQPLLSPAPSEGPTAKGQLQETFLGGTLLISFIFSTVGAFLMNVWTTPHVCSNNDVFFLKDLDIAGNKNVVSTTKFVRGLSIILQALPITAVVILITLDVLPHKWKPAVWLPVFPPLIVLLVLLARDHFPSGDSTQPKLKEKGQAAGGREGGPVAAAGEAPGIGSSSSNSGEAQQQKEPQDHKKSKEPDLPEDQKPAPLELTKLAFTGFLAVAMPSVKNASVGIPSIFFVLFTATTILLGLLWRLLTHEARPSEAVLKAANHASFFAHTFISFAGVAFWVMAVSANK